MLLETISQFRVQKVDVNGLREAFFQQRGLTYLTPAKQEHSFIQAVLYVKYSMIHNKLEFPQINCGYSRKIRNVIADILEKSATMLQK